MTDYLLFLNLHIRDKPFSTVIGHITNNKYIIYYVCVWCVLYVSLRVCDVPNMVIYIYI